MRDGQIKNGIVEAAIAFIKTDERIHLDRIRELVELLEKQNEMCIAITRHAVSRFMEQSKCKSPQSAEATIKSMVPRAQELELKDRYKAIQLINHNYKDARYLRLADWMLVLCGNVVVTCYRITAKRWKKADKTINHHISKNKENNEHD